MDPARLSEVVLPSSRDLASTTFAPAPENQSDGRLDDPGRFVVRQPGPEPTSKPAVEQPAPRARVVVIPTWRQAGASFYGPGFYGKRTACGLALTTTLVGVAHRTLACGTRITFKNPANGRVLTVPVVDRGPYVAGRLWDLTGAACTKLDHCYTGRLYWKYAG
jgi:rare lipoprotein A (peptidoglycan hydrolase)